MSMLEFMVVLDLSIYLSFLCRACPRADGDENPRLFFLGPRLYGDNNCVYGDDIFFLTYLNKKIIISIYTYDNKRR